MQAFFVLLLLGLSADDTDAASDADNFVDALLKDLRVKMATDGLDPLILPEKGFEFHKKILFIDITGDAKVYDGKLTGFSDTRRTGSTVKSENATHISVETTIGWKKKLEGHYEAEAKFMKIGPHLKVDLEIADLSVTLKIEQARKAGRPTITFFHVANLGKVTVKITSDLHFVDWIINKVSNFVNNLVKDYIVMIAEHRLKDLILKVLNTIDVPSITGSL